MMESIEVLVIGTDPPCPRCDLLTLRVQDAAKDLERPITVRHCAFFSDEARAVGRSTNRRLGTPKHVADDAGITVDWAQRDEMVEEQRRRVGAAARPAETWTPGLDALLDPCRKAAESARFLMTPILVVNGAVKHHGSVCTVEQIRDWLISA
jgi:hypothetical protein